jgi:tetratricopeptide (TPR) repeat protein
MAGPPVFDSERPDRLDGWKAIASYLGRSVRTVQRWELTEGLPVHRHPHQKLSSAWAYRGQLEQWVARRSELSTEPTGEPAAGDVVLPASGEAAPVGGSSPGNRSRWASMLGVSIVVGASLLASQHQAFRWQAPTAAAWDGRDTPVPGARAAFATGRDAYLERRYGEALEAVEQAIARDEAYASAWILLAKIHGRLASAGMSPERAAERAAAAAARARALAPSSAEAHVAEALAARARRDVRAWRAHAQRAIELDPTSAEGHGVLADSYSGQLGFACGRDRNPEFAESHYQIALEINPRLHTARVNRAQNLAYLGRYEACEALLAPFIEATGDLSALATRARCALMGDNLAAATGDIERLTATPGAAPSAVFLHRGWLRLKRGDFAAGALDLEAAADLQRSFQMELQVAQAFADVGHASRAAAHLERAFVLDSSCARTVAAAASFQIVRHAPEVSATLANYGVR